MNVNSEEESDDEAANSGHVRVLTAFLAYSAAPCFLSFESLYFLFSPSRKFCLFKLRLILLIYYLFFSQRNMEGISENVCFFTIAKVKGNIGDILHIN